MDDDDTKNENGIELYEPPESRESPFSRELALAGLFQISTRDRPADYQREFELGNGRTLVAFGEDVGLYEEDTLLAVLALSLANSKSSALMEQAMAENQQMMRLLERDMAESEEEDRVYAAQFMSVHLTAVMSMYAINKYLGLSTGGSSLAKRYASLERLSNVRIAVNTPSRRNRTPMPLIELVDVETHKSTRVVQVTVSQRVKESMLSVIGIDMALRNKLSPIGKMLHKLLVVAGFPKRTSAYEMSLAEIKKFAGSTHRQSVVEDRIINACDIMVEHSFIRGYEIQRPSPRRTRLLVK